ncbi:MAG: ORF6N domain-containing protein [Bacteroidetes bacterium]|nr:MAG: ORF6N domain-containing protein [Bacteroidota bacterium]
MPTSKSLIPVERIEKSILLIRGHKVMLDADLAELYGVTTGRLNEQVRRNKERFPKDFGFQLTTDEFEILISQFATSKSGRGGRRKRPWAFTEHGILMLSSVLRSKRAIQVNIQIMRAFVRMRQLLASHKGLMEKILAMEKKYDKQFKIVFEAIRHLWSHRKNP